MQALDTVFIKRYNVVCARHIPLALKHAEDENRSTFVTRPKQLTKDCEINFVTAEQYQNEMLLNRDLVVSKVI